MDWTARLRDAFGSATPEPAVVDELAQHAEAVYDELRADGVAADEADRRVDALIARWVTEAPALKHRVRRPPVPTPPPMSRRRLLGGVAQDAAYALRLLRRQPRFAALVILTLALSVGTTTALFGVTYGVLLKPLPWAGADRLVLLKETRGGRAPRFGSFSNAAYLAWRDQPATIEDIGACSPRTVTLTGVGEPERLRATAVTASLFRVLAARPLAGSLFTERDESSPVVVISESLWRQHFGRDPNAIGRGLQLDGDAYTIVGVLPDSTGYPDRTIKLWLPFRVAPATGNLLSMFDAMARMRPEATPAQVAAEGTSRGRNAADTGMTTTAIFGGSGPIEVSATPLAESLTGEVRRPLQILLAAVGLLLLISATNIASLQLARAASRVRELAIRASLGASVGRIVRQLIVENLVLGALGGAAGVGLAWWLERSAPSILPSDFPRAAELGVDTPIVLFGLAASVMTSLACAAWLAIRMRRLNLTSSLAEDGTSPVGAGARSSVARARLAIVGGQIAIACLLLVGAFLLARSFERLLHADRGYDPAVVLTARLSTPSGLYTPARRREILDAISERLVASPGVAAAAFSTELPITPGGSTSAFTMPALDGSGGTVQVQASPRIVSYGYFSTLGMRILEGRGLLSSDSATSEPVVVVNETFRKRYLGQRAIGAALPMALWGQSETGTASVVGVVEDVRYIGAATTSLAEIYFSPRQLSVGVRPATAALFVRSPANAQALAGLVRDTVAAVDRSLAPESIMTLESRLLAGSLARPRLYAVLIVSFAVIALVVTGVGLFSVLTYTVAQRTRELGVRAALGATRRDLIRLVLRQTATMALIGTAIGLLASLWLTRFTASLLYGVTTTDMVTYVTVPVLIFLMVVVACLGPARRAARLDPLKALRS